MCVRILLIKHKFKIKECRKMHSQRQWINYHKISDKFCQCYELHVNTCVKQHKLVLKPKVNEYCGTGITYDIYK